MLGTLRGQDGQNEDTMAAVLLTTGSVNSHFSLGASQWFGLQYS
jgi:hypothetical protein